MEPNEKSIFAALANDRVRLLWAQVTTGTLPEELSKRQLRDIDLALDAGLLEKNNEGIFAPNIFKKFLAASSNRSNSGWQRFLSNGRVNNWPSRAKDKEGLCLWIIDQTIPDGGTFSEQDINKMLSNFTDDPAMVRRYGVDLGLLTRNGDGSSYTKNVNFEK